MTPISFMGANYVARELGYRMPGGVTGGWREADRRTNQRFAPVETFEERFGAILADVVALGFSAMDVWTAHLNPRWATDTHLDIAARLLREHGLRVPSLAGSVGATLEEFRATCRVAAAIGAPVLGGVAPVLAGERDGTVATLEEFDLVLAVENHPERTPEELLAVIGAPAGGRVGAAVDTGWWATHGYDAADAIATLGERVLHVHLKDVTAPGGHDTVAFGEGCVPLRRCVEELDRAGYAGALSIEHEPVDHDPGPACRQARSLVEGWRAA